MKDIALTLNSEEQTALMQLIDAALRHAGSHALDVAAHFKAKLAAAQAHDAHDAHHHAHAEHGHHEPHHEHHGHHAHHEHPHHGHEQAGQ